MLNVIDFDFQLGFIIFALKSSFHLGAIMELPLEMRSYLTSSQAKMFSEMSEGEQHMIVSTFMRNRLTKNQLLLWWFLLGAHYIKLRKIGLQLLFWCTGLGGVIWWIVDLFRLDKLADEFNKNLIRELL